MHICEQWGSGNKQDLEGTTCIVATYKMAKMNENCVQRVFTTVKTLELKVLHLFPF